MKYLTDINNYFDSHLAQVVISLVLVFIFLIAKSILFKIIKRHATQNEVTISRQVYMQKLLGLILFFLFALVVGLVWEISLQGLSVYFASIFAVVGVALFANWSILSNLTASIILFFFFPYRIGDDIKIVDGDNSVEGQIMDITLFYIKILTSEKQIYSYPNNLALQKPIKQLKASDVV